LCEPESEELQIAKTWANELLKMNKSQQMFAKKGIADILFEGQLGTLNRDSIQINTISSIDVFCFLINGFTKVKFHRNIHHPFLKNF